MTPVARQALVITCCCSAACLVSYCVAIVVALNSIGSADAGGMNVALGLYVFGTWMGLNALFLTLYNQEEWGKR